MYCSFYVSLSMYLWISCRTLQFHELPDRKRGRNEINRLSDYICILHMTRHSCSVKVFFMCFHASMPALLFNDITYKHPHIENTILFLKTLSTIATIITIITVGARVHSPCQHDSTLPPPVGQPGSLVGGLCLKEKLPECHRHHYSHAFIFYRGLLK